MKLRVRIQRQTSRVELPGGEPTLQELSDLIKQTLLSSHGLGTDTDFSLSLNGSELLSDSGQTLSSCGIVSGDLICVLLHQPAPGTSSSCAEATPSAQRTPDKTTCQPSSSSDQEVLMETLQTCDGQEPDPVVSVWEPMLCSEAEEGQAPLSLELLYHSARVSGPNEAVMVAVHLLMLETGFTPQGGELKPDQMPAGWRSPSGPFRLQYSHPLCGSSLVSVAAVSMGPLLVINQSLKVTETVDAVRKLQLNASSFVTDEWPGESAAAAFRHLKKLSQVVKDQLVFPLIAAARHAMALPTAFGLSVLPLELLLRVLRLLDVRSLVRLSAVSRHFSAAAADSMLWRHLYRRDFTDAGSSRSRDTDWKELYRKSFEARSERRRALRSFCQSPYRHRDVITPVPHPLLPPLPGIIGGEYDQRAIFPHDLLPRPRYDPLRPIADPAGRPRPDPRRPSAGRAPDILRGFI
ncbi:F-box only protein 7 isoform X2 [Austrofundulus limnaeus]|uniref:F-box only protein 7 isoform X2 n=1 Tax=Austrofundulus limnaeus TaxID=52670 RepID=A0A2I4D4N5_AUSLI|nr:PREDICTED: F-box only protein 7 isoform X2 [Austrofundulus limnaeus]